MHHRLKMRWIWGSAGTDRSMPRRSNPEVLPGRTIVCGTEQGLYCRAQRLHSRELVVQATTEDGCVHGPHRLDLDDPEALLRCCPCFSMHVIFHSRLLSQCEQLWVGTSPLTTGLII